MSAKKKWATLVRSSRVPAFLCADLTPAYIPNYGLAHSFDNFESTMGESGNGWVMLETALVRVDTQYAPSSNFSILREFHLNRAPVIITEIGFDAVVCVEAYEPWIVQIYNSSLGVPTTMAIVGKSASTDFETDYGARDPHPDSYTRALNSTGKDSAFRLGYAGSFPFERY